MSGPIARHDEDQLVRETELAHGPGPVRDDLEKPGFVSSTEAFPRAAKSLKREGDHQAVSFDRVDEAFSGAGLDPVETRKELQHQDEIGRPLQALRSASHVAEVGVASDAK